MYKIIGVHEVEQPIYKIQQRGAESLPDEELLALVLRIPQRDDCNVLAKLRGFLKRNPLQSLADFQIETPPEQIVNRQLVGNDLTKAQLLTLKATIELARRVLDKGLGTQPSISSPVDVLPELRDIKDKKREHFVAIFLNARNQIIKTDVISMGSLNASLVHPREVFAPAVASSAASVILAHNHPSGDTAPSRDDIDLTRRLVQSGEILGIEVLDHIIIGSDRFISLKEANVF